MIGGRIVIGIVFIVLILSFKEMENTKQSIAKSVGVLSAIISEQVF